MIQLTGAVSVSVTQRESFVRTQNVWYLPFVRDLEVFMDTSGWIPPPSLSALFELSSCPPVSLAGVS